MEEVEYVAAVDLGSDTSVACRVSTKSLRTEILRNDLSNEKTPMCISFAGGQRSYGEVAMQLMTTNKNASIDSLLNFVDYAHRTPEERQNGSFTPFVGQFETHDEFGHRLQVEVNGKEYKLHGEQVLAMMLAKLGSFSNVDGKQIPLAVAIPDCFTRAQQQAVRDAAHLAGIQLKLLVTRTEAAAMDYGTKRSAESLEDSAVLLVDVGHSYASAAIYKWEGKKGVKVASACSEGISGRAVDLAIFTELEAELKEREGVSVPVGSKGAIRFMTQIRKLKESLSAVNEASITVESLVEDKDIKFKMTRDRLETICAPIAEKMASLVADVIKACSDEVLAKLKSCELIGGGMRIPFFKKAIQSSIVQDTPLAYTMDSMSAVASGAALCCAKVSQPKVAGVIRPALEQLANIVIADAHMETITEEDEEAGNEATDGGKESNVERHTAPSLLSAEALEKAKEDEAHFREMDEKMRELHHAKNLLESRIFEARGLANGSLPHSDLVDKAACNKAADEFEEWLFDYETGGSSPDITAAEYKTKLEELNKALEPACADYLAKIEEDRAKHDAEMEESAKQAAAEQEANGGKDDHDNRKLKKPERMRKVVLNKEEGNTLFKDGNYEAAALRYIRALQHCDKFFDLSPEDEKEVDSIKLSLHLNSAQCHIKVKNFPQASKSATAALEIDSNSAKGLFRLAFAQENLKEFAAAKKNLTKAKELAPEDVAVQKLMERVEAQIKREKAKERAMAKRMFG
mmetsp:Transcript_7915/g.14014  ORF Transcript_7915/g.14014 Transcript_7915/m.14014 type:complete len:746 (+) Transcript_7915:43-2280(+)